MVSPNRSFSGLSERLENIYKTYTDDLTSEHTLDSDNNEAAVTNDSRPANAHISSRLLSLPPETDSDPHTAPVLPHLSNSFDFYTTTGAKGITSSSLNVLLDTPTTESQYKLLISTPPIIETGRPPMAHRRGASADNDSAEWIERGAAVSQIVSQESISGGVDQDDEADTVIRRTVKDFVFGKDLGEGSYSTVVLATDKHTAKKYAVKILDKRHIIKEKKVKYVNIEKHSLNRLNESPGIVSLFFTFQDKYSLYFVLEYAANGELLNLIKKYGSLNEDATKHLGAQILDAIHFMHENGVVHRDIKPENILLDEKFRVKITDFGTAKLLEKRKGETGIEEDYPVDVRAKSFVGTAEYVSPELLDSKYCGKPGDIWAFGCILYQMVAGKPPFKATNEYLTFQKITKLQYAFSAGFPLILRDLIKKILVLQPLRRSTIDKIQIHPFFAGINFLEIWETPIPELGPYKMTAKSMMKMPTSAKSSPQQASSKAKPKQRQAEIPSRNTATEGKGTQTTAAAYVLSKRDSEADESDSTSRTSLQPNGSRGSTLLLLIQQPDYIPGTNILRPVINTRASFARASTNLVSSRTEERKRASSKVMEVGPLTSVDLAWQKYFKSPSERVLHIGSAIVCRQPTEYFEKKNRGLIHDAPLGFTSTLQALARRTNGTSMLSQAARGNRGLRGTSIDSSSHSESYDEMDAVIYHQEVPDVPENTKVEPTGSKDAANPSHISSSRIGKAIFKKLLHSEKKPDAAPEAQSVKSSPSGSGARVATNVLEKPRTCTMVVTTHGRMLVFARDDHKNEYDLIVEIRLLLLFIKFKEVVTASSKFGKILPSTGIFAIEAIQSTFAFEVEKHEVAPWTEALAKSKLNQLHRELPDDSHKTELSPRLLDAPTFSSSKPKETTPPPSSRPSQTSAKGRSPQKHVLLPHQLLLDPKSNQLLQSKLRNKTSIKRKPPPPPTSTGLNLSGLGRDLQYGDNVTIQAAMIAVLNKPQATVTERRSSFSRENNGHSEHTPGRSSSGPGATITLKNSKLLARSRGKNRA